MRLCALLTAAILTLAPSGLSAQERRAQPTGTARDTQQSRKWWFDEKYRAALGLSPQQVARVDALFEEHAAVQRELWKSLQDAERAVSKLMATESPQEPQVVAAIERTELLRYKINERRALLLFRIRQQLSLEQHRKLEKLHERHRAERSRAGRERSPIWQ